MDQDKKDGLLFLDRNAAFLLMSVKPVSALILNVTDGGLLVCTHGMTAVNFKVFDMCLVEAE